MKVPDAAEAGPFMEKSCPLELLEDFFSRSEKTTFKGTAEAKPGVAAESGQAGFSRFVSRSEPNGRQDVQEVVARTT